MTSDLQRQHQDNMTAEWPTVYFTQYPFCLVVLRSELFASDISRTQFKPA